MNRKGFTLIELLIVVVIIGILAAIAIPKFANTKDKAYIASMKSDLRNLVTAEEAYFADSLRYGNVAALGTNYATTSGVISLTIAVAGDGWTAMWAPANTPAGAIERMQAAVQKVLAMPAVRGVLTSKLAVTPHYRDAQQMAQAQRTELATWEPIIKASGFKPE